jgi:hypothetical protein
MRAEAAHKRLVMLGTLPVDSRDDHPACASRRRPEDAGAETVFIAALMLHDVRTSGAL